ncbi:MAG: MoxR family ATPase [Oscillospiraceae bacterium]|nr:MoxR family ATPase [Oscillospiraceae bacterium]MBQ8337983.1 MoxR family ATPase [Oscillospiraceae bacterium]
MDNNLLQKYSAIAQEIQGEVRKVVLGKDEIIEKILATALAGGHVLLDDIPGVGKTTLALAFSYATSMDYHRMQFTPDVLPSDVTGFSIYDKKTDSFVYKEGVAICNLFLADEINRTSSKTQSALLEIMEEGKVTVDGVNHTLPQPYVVIATQNPIGSVGTQMLPDSQLDRFMVCVSMGYPSMADEISILKGRQKVNPLNDVKAVATKEDIMTMKDIVSEVYTDDKIYEYIAAISDETRKSEMLKLGLSPRGSLALARAARAVAFLHGRDYVIPDDVAFIFFDVATHRVVVSAKAKISGATTKEILAGILAKVPAPKLTQGK